MEPLSDLDALGRLLLAMAVGAVLGTERERADKPAGIRTYMLVCEGSALFMICSVLIAQAVGGPSVDPTRIASTVVQGVGFLAGGVILTSGRRVHGMTTAAGIWVAAALGLLIGAGFFVVAVAAGLITVVALVVLRVAEGKLPVSRKGEPD